MTKNIYRAVQGRQKIQNHFISARDVTRRYETYCFVCPGNAPKFGSVESLDNESLLSPGGRWLKPKFGSVVSACRKFSGILAAGSGAGKHSILRCWHENSILRYDYENPIWGNDWTQFWGQCKKPILGCSNWAGWEVFARNGVNR